MAVAQSGREPRQITRPSLEFCGGSISGND